MTMKPCCLVSRPCVALRGGMKGKQSTASLGQSHILYEYGIGSSISNLTSHGKGIFKLIIIDNGVERHIYLCAKAVGVIAELCYVGYGIACRSPCSVSVCTNIYGIGTMIDGSDAAFEILCRSQKFEGLHFFWSYWGVIQSY